MRRLAAEGLSSYQGVFSDVNIQSIDPDLARVLLAALSSQSLNIACVRRSRGMYLCGLASWGC